MIDPKRFWALAQMTSALTSLQKPFKAAGCSNSKQSASTLQISAMMP